MATPSERFGRPVIGRVTTKPLRLTRRSRDGSTTEEVVPSRVYEVIEVAELSPGDREKVYVTNVWYKEHRGICLLILGSIAEKFEDLRPHPDGRLGG